MNRMNTIRATLSLLALAAAPLCNAAAPPVMTPLPPAMHPEPNVLSTDERRGVMLELKRLTAELRAARAEAAQNPALDPIKAKLAEASTNTSPESASAVAALKRELSDAEAILLSEMKGVPRKQVRTLELGRLLEYDTKLRKDLRRRSGTANFGAQSDNADGAADGGANASGGAAADAEGIIVAADEPEGAGAAAEEW
jgi:hypothetical protein